LAPKRSRPKACSRPSTRAVPVGVRSSGARTGRIPDGATRSVRTRLVQDPAAPRRTAASLRSPVAIGDIPEHSTQYWYN
jgi:hypothetical protein